MNEGTFHQVFHCIQAQRDYERGKLITPCMALSKPPELQTSGQQFLPLKQCTLADVPEVNVTLPVDQELYMGEVNDCETLQLCRPPSQHTCCIDA